MAFFSMFARSAKELKSVRCLTVTAMLIALDIVLKMTVSIKLTDSLKISFAFIALAAIAALFGPTVAGLAGIITDVLGYLIKPEGNFNPLFTIVEATGAIIYGIFLYNLLPVKLNFREIKSNSKTSLFQVARIIAAKTSVVVVCNLVMTPFALIFSGFLTFDSFAASFGARVLKNALQFPVDCVLLLVLLFPIVFAYRKVFGAKAVA